jgi:hypothetical protein
MYTFTICIAGRYYVSEQRFDTTNQTEGALTVVTELFNLNGWALDAAFIHQA